MLSQTEIIPVVVQTINSVFEEQLDIQKIDQPNTEEDCLYSKCINQYQDKTEINRLILQSIMQKFKKSNLNENQIAQMDENNYPFIKEIQENLKNFLELSEKKDSNKWDHISFLYFKITHFLTSDQYNKDQYQPSKQNIKELINFLMELDKQLLAQYQHNCQEFKNLIKKENYKDIDYENCYEQQNFTHYFLEQKEYKYSNFFQKCNIIGSKQLSFSGVLKEEETFFRDLIDCYNIYGNMQLIKCYKDAKQLLYFLLMDNFFEEESKTNLIKDYQIHNFKFFDKFDIYNVLIDSKTIDYLEEDELYLYFLTYALINLVKFNYLIINKEIKFKKLITKIQTLKNLNSRFELGYTFILKFMMDMQQKSYLSEENTKFQNSTDEVSIKSTISLYKEWANDKYVVQDSYFNKEQLQLYIDAIQSILALAILPELARFYGKEEQLPYQPTELDIGYIQQIIRGKRLYLKNSDKTELNIKYWTDLIENIKKNIIQTKKEKFITKQKKKQNKQNQLNEDFDPWIEELEGQFYFKVCQINQQILTMTNNKNSKNDDEQVTQLQQLIEALVKTIDMCQYYNIYRHRQTYYTLSYFFIDEKTVLNYIIKLIKKSKTPQLDYDDSQTTQNFILCLKNEFNIGTYIKKRKQIKFTSFNRIDNIFLRLSSDFISIAKAFQVCSQKIEEFQYLNNKEELQNDIEEIKQIKQKLQDMINFYGFLSRKEYLAFKINLEIYIKQIELIIELAQQDKQEKKFEFEKLNQGNHIGKSQFQVFKVSIKNKGEYAMKQVADNKEKRDFAKQQMREISILSTIPCNQYIIKYKGYNPNGQSFQLFLEYFESQTLSEYYTTNIFRQNKWSNSTEKEKIKRIKIKKLKICIQILQAIEFLHQLNIVHGDIKPGNILINPQKGQKNIKLIDFSESGFMIEETLGYTQGFKEKNEFKSIYSDYVSAGVLLMKLLYFTDFSYKCDCEDQQKCEKSTLHKKKIKENFNTELLKNYDKYLLILFKQIMSLFNDQPYLRCSLEELIYLMQIQIEIIENEDNQQFKQQKIYEYEQRYGLIQRKSEIMDNSDNQLQFSKNDCNEIQENSQQEIDKNFNSQNSSQQNQINENEKINMQDDQSSNMSNIQYNQIKIQFLYAGNKQEINSQDQFKQNCYQNSEQQNQTKNLSINHEGDKSQDYPQNYLQDDYKDKIKILQSGDTDIQESIDDQTILKKNWKKFRQQNKITEKNEEIKQVDKNCFCYLEKNIKVIIELKDLENYFINNINQIESYPRIIQRLKSLNINLRQKQINMKSFKQLKTIEKIYFAVDLVGLVNLNYFLDDFHQILKDLNIINQDINLHNIINLYNLLKSSINKEVRDKIINYYTSYQN
ncbi:hypothetical protein ABPG72_022133 [Tetrahymena utriculariae]